ncbi:hypothetical protein [Haloarcula marismortui]|jgi:hypothetical protein|uniref:Uncharacterized protein n=1 Tax=Haloarcula marismortui ATCC 33799 TaxID=662475 RepID=M0JNG8_9EURY|nr:hypothetical protein [Haloarcula californiae]EMA09489.1 hypothetical protein C435_22014 [Haloarcula californiae ATCC 33799]
MDPTAGIGQSIAFAAVAFVFAIGFFLMLTVGQFGGVVLRLTLMRRLLGQPNEPDPDTRGSLESFLLVVSIMAGTWVLFLLLPDEIVFGAICLSAVLLTVRRVLK